MGFLDSLFASKKQTSSVPLCASCSKPMKENPCRISGTKIFEDAECSSCGSVYCLYCQIFGVLGPKFPGCGEYKLGMLIRA